MQIQSVRYLFLPLSVIDTIKRDMPCDPSLTTSLTRSKYGKSTSAIECPSTYTSVTSAKLPKKASFSAMTACVFFLHPLQPQNKLPVLCHFRKRPKMSQRPYLRAFCKARKFHFYFFSLKISLIQTDCHRKQVLIVRSTRFHCFE